MQSPFEAQLQAITQLEEYDNYIEVLSRKNIVDVEVAEQNSVELFRFLFLKAITANLSPSKLVDSYWHTLLLFRLLYNRVCKILLTSKTSVKYIEDIINHDHGW